MFIATTQFSPELSNLDWGGSIITKIYHTAPPPSDYFATTQFSPEWINLDWGGSVIAQIYHTTPRFVTLCLAM